VDSEYFKSVLMERRQAIELIRKTGDEAAGIVELDQTRVGRLSRMDAMQSQAMSREAQRRRELEITRIDQALQRIERDEFGICVSCDEEIGIERLKLDPSNPFCIHCAK